MNKILTLALSALMVLAMFAAVSPASAEEHTVDSVEIRGPVYNGSDFQDIFTNKASDNKVQTDPVEELDYLEMNVTNFAGFYYDLDDNLKSETLRLYNESTTIDDATEERSIAEGALVYNSSIIETNYTADAFNGTFPLQGFFAEKYVPLTNTTPDQLARLVLDNDDKHTLRVGNSIDLGNGYELTPKQIDVDGEQVWMELTKDGEFVDDEVMDVAGGEDVWTYEQDILDEDDVPVLKVYVSNVFQGQVDSLAVVEGLWMINPDDVREIEDGDTFGNLEVDTIKDTSLILTNDGSISLNSDDTQNVAEGMQFRTADSDDLRFYLMKEYTEPGTYEVRGTVATGAANWSYENFAGFYYELDDNEGTETLSVNQAVSDGDRSIDDGNLIYETNLTEVDYTADAFNDDDPTGFPIMGFFAEKYVPLTNTTPDNLARLVLDNDDKHSLRVGNSIDLGNGYELTPKQIDVDGEQVWMELTKDGEFVDDEVMDVAGGEDVWTYEQDILDEDDVPVLKVYVSNVFQGQVDSLAVVEGLWMINPDDVREIEDGDTFGNLEVDTIGDTKLTLTNDDSITLNRDDTATIAENMNFRIADDSTLRYYPYVEMTIAGEEEPTEPEMPTAGFTADPTSGEVPLEVTFTDESENAEEYSWEFGDGETSTEANPTHTYEETGTYTVTLTVSNDEGEDTAEQTIRVREVGEPEPEMPTAGFTADPTSGEVPLEVTFTDESENAEEYSWDFGDGNTSTEASPTHTYETAGDYTVTLTVSNDEGEDTAETTITVEEPTDEEPDTPGFEAVFAIAGLLAIAFLVRRRN